MKVFKARRLTRRTLGVGVLGIFGLLLTVAVSAFGVARADAVSYTYSGHLRTDDGTALSATQVSLGTSGIRALTGPDGSFSVTALAGDYPIIVWTDNHYDQATIPGGPNEVYLTNGTLHLDRDVNQELTLPLVNLTVRTVDVSGNPVANVPVAAELHSSSGQYFGDNPQLYPTWFGNFINRANTDAAGTVTFRVLRNSWYAWPCTSHITAYFPEGAVRKCGGNTPFITADTTLTIVKGAPNTNNDARSEGVINNTPYIYWPSNYSPYPVDHFDIYRDNVKIASTTDLSFIDYTAPEGFHDYTIVSVGANGAESEPSRAVAQLYVDKTAPVIANAALSTAVVEKGAPLRLTASVSDPGTYFSLVFINQGRVEYYIDTDPGRGQATQVSLSGSTTPAPAAADINTNIEPGPHTLYVRASDGLGNNFIPTDPNWSEVIALPFTVSLPAPAHLGANAYTTNTAPVLSWSAVNNADHYDVYRDGVRVGTTSQTHFTDSTLSAEGNHVYAVRAVAANGFAGDLSSSITVGYDTTAPTASNVLLTGGISIHEFYFTTMNATVTADAADAVSGLISGVTAAEYYIDTDPGRGNGGSMNYADGKVTTTASLGGLSSGQHTLYVRVKDAAGNWSGAVSKSFRILH